MSISERIEQAPACEVITLDEAERAVYTGAGWKLARFENGRLAEFFDPLEQTAAQSAESAASAAANKAIAWIAAARGEVWLVLCSCGQLCEPRRITLTDASALARMVRVFAEQFAEMD